VVVVLVSRRALLPAPVRPAETPSRRFGRALWWVVVAAVVAAAAIHLVIVARLLRSS